MDSGADTPSSASPSASAALRGCFRFAAIAVPAPRYMDSGADTPSSASPSASPALRDCFRFAAIAVPARYMDSGADTPSSASPSASTVRVATARESRAPRTASSSTRKVWAL